MQSLASTDPYAGSVRYHLGLFTPNDDRCFIEVDGQRHSWRDGEAVIFDETYVHWAENKSDQTRIILFCDIERPMKWRWAQAVNHWVGTTLMSAASSPNDENDSTGGINRIFKYVHAGRERGQRLKKGTVRPITPSSICASSRFLPPSLFRR